MPGVSVAALSVFVIDRSAVMPSVSASVAVLLAAVGSVTADGAPTVAVFANVPVADAPIVAVREYVAVPPTARLMVSAMSPLPLAVQVEPAEGVQLQIAEDSVAGSASATVAPMTFDGPLLVTTTE